jgi:hypothetical protein
MSTAILDQRKAVLNNIQNAMTELSRQHPDQPTPYINTHHFADGVYVRAYYGFKGSMVVSQVHLHEHITILAAGHCRVVSTMQNEEQVDVYKDFAIMKTPPHTKRALYFLEDTTILTIHPNPENVQDVEAIEHILVADDFEDIQ